MAYIKSADLCCLWGDRGRKEKREKRNPQQPSERRKNHCHSTSVAMQRPARKAPCSTRLLHFPFAKPVHLFQYLIFYQTLLLKDHRIVPKGMS